jgi:hypothetical protein
VEGMEDGWRNSGGYWEDIASQQAYDAMKRHARLVVMKQRQCQESLFENSMYSPSLDPLRR